MNNLQRNIGSIVNYSMACLFALKVGMGEWLKTSPELFDGQWGRDGRRGRLAGRGQ
jgi:hypothetical protein